ncbi:hypothetical protein [Streptomyces sp. NBC_00162]|uniref:hypothetical protein n=1 Tax=Streptomyces sp. NBC_00162 TaxID=2903629 RepID=UPI00214CC0FA|nr:hypothetical protein [Streptomyces sp. NBC_00162]UUU37593.1 hypothetical protein JIW86_00795 [Streptomyces sp. NBC_00162]
MDAHSNDPTAATPRDPPRVICDTLSARTLAHAEHGLAVFVARWEYPEEIAQGHVGEVVEGER